MFSRAISSPSHIFVAYFQAYFLRMEYCHGSGTNSFFSAQFALNRFIMPQCGRNGAPPPSLRVYRATYGNLMTKANRLSPPSVQLLVVQSENRVHPTD